MTRKPAARRTWICSNVSAHRQCFPVSVEPEAEVRCEKCGAPMSPAPLPTPAPTHRATRPDGRTIRVTVPSRDDAAQAVLESWPQVRALALAAAAGGPDAERAAHALARLVSTLPVDA